MQILTQQKKNLRKISKYILEKNMLKLKKYLRHYINGKTLKHL